jgi:flagella basal body P-ring formation protein FlgA
MKKLLLVLLCLLYAPTVWSDEKQSRAEISKVVLEFIQAKTQNMSGKVAIQVSDIDPRTSLAACAQLEAFLPTGAQLQGKTSIGVRCNEKNGWSLFIPATITITINTLVSSKPLQQGQTVKTGDFNIQSGELNQMGIITDEAQALGKVLKFSISAGQVLKQEMLRAPYAVTQGQTVQILVERPGMTLRSEGKALNNAAEGESVQVKVASGQVISGTAKESGIVSMRP